MQHPLRALLVAIAAISTHAGAEEILVNRPDELATALKNLKARSVLKIGPGDYRGGNSVSNIADLTITAADPSHPPRFTGGNEAWHFTRCDRLKLSHLHVSGQSMNGINLDDGGDLGNFVKGVVLEKLEVSDVGPHGNYDAIKVSGLEDITIRDCRIEGWGGEAIDFVGCRKSLVTDCELKGKAGFDCHVGIQLKGGSESIVVEKCHFTDAGLRPVNMGGSTGLPFFRPPDAPFEARNIIVRDNVIEGSECAIACVGLDGGEITNNTIRFPKKWFLRILQESTDKRFAPCRNVTFKNNRVTFRRADVQVDVNIGPATAAPTFRFDGNQWFAEDQPQKSKPSLPSEETNGTYGVAPKEG